MRLISALLFALVAAHAAPSLAAAQASADARLVWRTVRTQHFEVTYHEPLGISARRVATIAERVHAGLTRVLEHRTQTVTRIVLTDDSDSANGYATALPYNTIGLYVTAPDDLSPLGDYDDWLTELITHEHTHILQMDQITGLPAIINAILGRVYSPNMVAPRWFLEGLAVYEESQRTAGGRLRSTMFDMFMRMDALSGRLFPIEQMSNPVDRWPHGNVPYLYGSHFVEYIARTHGDAALAQIIRGYGDALVPYGLNRQAQNATGRTYTALYADFLDAMRAQYTAQKAELEARGLREGTRLTQHGEEVRTPRFLAPGRVVYWVSDGRSIGQIRTLNLDGTRPVTITRVSGVGQTAPHPNGVDLVYSAEDGHRDLYFYNDLFRRDLRTGTVQRLTQGMRATEPDVSPDGRRVAFVVNGAGTTHLCVAELRDVPGTQQFLLRSARFGQVYSPRWSPDGRTIAVSTWRRGGFRDVQLVDVATGEVRDVTHDRALDTGPAWAPDGRTLYFSSDRTGVANLYAYSVETRELRQVSNVLGGAYQPAISPDGQTVVYVGYTTYGWDLHVMPLDASRFTPAPDYVDDRPAASDAEALLDLDSTPYDPLPTLPPFSYLVDLSNDGWGPQLGVSVRGGDLVGWHAYSLRLGISVITGEPSFDLNYSFRRTALGASLHAYHSIGPRTGFVLGGEEQKWIGSAWGADASVSYRFLHPNEYQQIALTYSAAYLLAAAPLDSSAADPNEDVPQYPERGFSAGLNLGWVWSNAQRYTYDIATSEGTTVGVNAGVNDPVLGSQFRSATLTWFLQQHLGISWIANDINARHVVSFRYAGGVSAGDLGRRGAYAVGGYPDVNLLDSILTQNVLGGVALRGYAPGDRTGTQYHLAQLDYRFPIWRPQWGIETIPFYINRLYGLVFADAGDATYGGFDLERFRFGVGGELLLDVTVGYFIGFTLRVGVARGLSDGGQTQVYAHLGSPF